MLRQHHQHKNWASCILTNSWRPQRFDVGLGQSEQAIADVAGRRPNSSDDALEQWLEVF